MSAECVSPGGMLMQYGSHHVSSRTTRRREVEGGMILGECCVELSVNKTDRPAGAKLYTRSVVTVCSVQKLTRLSLPDTHCSQHSTVPKLHMLLELDLWITSKITTKSHQLLLSSPCLLPIAPRLTFLWQTRKVNLATRS